MSNEEATPAHKRSFDDLEAHVASLPRRRTSRNLNDMEAEERRTLGRSREPPSV
jgi:hypothetical protein